MGPIFAPDEKSGAWSTLQCMVYLITWCCYGSRVPGEEGIVSRRNHLVGAPRELENPDLARAARGSMLIDAYKLDASQREIVLWAIVEVCRHRGWTLLAAHVRTAHVHSVVDAEIAPERILNAFKSYSTRALNRDRPWARHGSTFYLWTAEEVTRAVRYVVSKQGDPMAMYCYSSPGTFAGACLPPSIHNSFTSRSDTSLQELTLTKQIEEE
jgi:hypothetical protein